MKLLSFLQSIHKCFEFIIYFPSCFIDQIDKVLDIIIK